ncbi:MAG: hypothetical protein IPH31_24615 [Lewinellaceae bacterium]|nr:hypothetical protein [Lewinellaceae bacterium]
MTSALSYTNSFLMPTVLRSALEVANDTDFKELRKNKENPNLGKRPHITLLLRPLNAFYLKCKKPF